MMRVPLLGARPDLKEHETFAKPREQLHAEAVEPACYGSRNDTDRELPVGMRHRESTTQFSFSNRGIFSMESQQHSNMLGI